MEKKTIIVTGVAGFIGSNLCGKLLEMGHKVIGIDNFSYGFERNISNYHSNENFQFIEGNLLNEKTLEKLNGEVIVHLASQKIPRYENALRTLEENSGMLKSIMSKSIKDKIKIVYASTSDVYGKNPILPYNEESDLVIGPTTVKRWAYAISKIYGEQYIIANGSEYDLDYTIMRFFGSYGPNQNTTWWGGPQSVFIQNALNNEPMEIHGDGSQTRTFTYIDDTVQGILKCIFHKDSSKEIFNIAAKPDTEITILDLAKLIWKLIRPEDKEPKFRFIPYSTFGKYEDVKRRVPDIDKIKEKLGFQPIYALQDGLIKTIEWQRNLSSD
jgi:UDP-glucose 4-epimerase